MERTVAGEVAQARSAGGPLGEGEYLEIVAAKSGSLVGAAACLGGALLGLGDVEERARLGRELGSVYQQVDDLMDYCPAANTGKPPLQDYRQRKWTWVLGVAGVTRFDLPERELLQAVFGAPAGGVSGGRRALAELRRRRDELLERVAQLAPGDTVVPDVLEGWIHAATHAVQVQEEALGVAGARGGRLAPASPEAEVAALARSAFEGRPTGVPLLDVTLGEAGTRGVSWRYPDAILAGVAMDLTRTRYPDWSTLEEYTFGVAGAVGGWITQLFAIHDEALLARAHALGHGLQLTNIDRDVGEDWARGRVYLPLELLREHGFEPEEIGRLAQGPGPLPPAWKALTEDLLRRAEARYEEAWPGIRELSGWYRRPVAVAAQAYRGIHEAIRRNGHDNLRRRAATTPARRVVLAASGLVRAYVPNGGWGPTQRHRS